MKPELADWGELEMTQIDTENVDEEQQRFFMEIWPQL